MHLDAWAKAAPFAFTNSAETSFVLEANSIRLLRAFFRRSQVRTLKFAAALDFVTKFMEPVSLPATADNFCGPAPLRVGAAKKDPDPKVAPRWVQMGLERLAQQFSRHST